jgi:hypothetical protein
MWILMLELLINDVESKYEEPHHTMIECINAAEEYVEKLPNMVSGHWCVKR